MEYLTDFSLWSLINRVEQLSAERAALFLACKLVLYHFDNREHTGLAIDYMRQVVEYCETDPPRHTRCCE